MSEAEPRPTQRLQPDLLEALASQIGDLFSFRVLDVMLFQSSGKQNINDIANKDWPTRKIAREVLTQVEREGNTKAFLSLVLAAQPENKELQASVLRAIPELGAAALKTGTSVGIVVGFLSQRAVSNAIRDSRKALRSFADDVDLLAVYKCLHDCLHKLQIRRFLDLSAAARSMKAEPRKIETLREFEQLLLVCVLDARSWADKLPDDAPLRRIELAWIDKLALAGANLGNSLDMQDGDATMLALMVIGRVIELEPPRLNTQIFVRAECLPVRRLVEVLASVSTLDPHAKDILAKACDALRDISATLVRRVVDHQLWQDADDGLWSLDQVFAYAGPDVFRPFCTFWASCKSKVRQLADAAGEAEWASRLIRYSDLVDDELTRAEGRVGADGRVKSPKAIRDGLFLRYNDFRHQARFVFFGVDRLLREECTEIVRIGKAVAVHA